MKPGSTGRVVPGYEARIVGEDGAEAGPGEAGQLEIRGDSTTPGYWNRPELEGRTIVDGWLRTGDQYVRDAEGWFHYQGRADDMIKVGGIWCSPFDIEARLMEHPSVLEAAVVGREDDHGLVKPEAHVVLSEPLRETAGAPPAADALRAELVAHCQEALPRYMYPRWIQFAAELAEDRHRQDPALPPAPVAPPAVTRLTDRSSTGGPPDRITSAEKESSCPP